MENNKIRINTLINNELQTFKLNRICPRCPTMSTFSHRDIEIKFWENENGNPLDGNSTHLDTLDTHYSINLKIR